MFRGGLRVGAACESILSHCERFNDVFASLSMLLRRTLVRADIAPRRRSSGTMTGPVLAISLLAVASLFGLLLLPPIAQDQGYHQFADQRTLLGVPNFWNVISNLPFIAVGAAGLRRFHHDPTTIVLFLGYF